MVVFAFVVFYDAFVGLPDRVGYPSTISIGIAGVIALSTSWLQWRPDQGYALGDELTVMRRLGMGLLVVSVAAIIGKSVT